MWTGTNFNSSVANVTVTELNHGIPFESAIMSVNGGVLNIITASYTSEKPLEPATYSFQLEYEGKTFGPYSYQTWCKFKQNLLFN